MKKNRIAAAVALFCLPLAAAAGPKGRLFIIGGGDWPENMPKRFVDLARSFDTGRIVIFPMASASPAETAAEEAADFKKAGATDVVVSILTREQALDPAGASVLDGAGGVFFSGGDQARLTAVLLDTPIHARLREIYGRGAVIGGTSAGAAVMSEVMITGDEVRKVEEGHEFETIRARNVITQRGFGFVRGAIVDQHFVTRKRYNRVLSLLAEHPDLFAIAIDESTAVVVESGETFEVVGLNQVIVCDPAGASYRIRPDGAIGFTGLVLHALVEGDVFDMTTRKARTS